MKKSLLLLTFVVFTFLNVNTASAIKMPRESLVKIAHHAQIKIKQTVLYGMPFFLGGAITQLLTIHTNWIYDDGYVDSDLNPMLIQTFLTGAFATYFWPKANKIK